MSATAPHAPALVARPEAAVGARAIGPALVTAGLTIAYVAFAVVQALVVNVDPGRHDQSAYLVQARALAASHFAEPTNRMQMPGFVVLQALFFDPAADDAHAFLRAKLVNIGVSVALLFALHAFFVRALPKREARVLTLVTAFTVFVFRAAYVQTEVCFYTLTFFGFAALCRLWSRPSYGVALAAGLFEGLAFLFKGSAEPGLVLFAALYLGREAWLAGRGRSTARAIASRLGELGAMAAVFLATTAPYCANSKRLYGSWFFNLSTHYVVWCDDWDQFMDMQRRWGPWATWDRSRPDLPSLASYLHDHSLVAIGKREACGLAESLGNVALGHGYFQFIVLYVAFAWVAFGGWRAVLESDARSPLLFVVPYVIVYLALFGFYAPIAAGERFTLMLFLPLLYSVLRAGAQQRPEVVVRGRRVTWDDVNVLALGLLAVHVVFVLPGTIGRVYAGG